MFLFFKIFIFFVILIYASQWFKKNQCSKTLIFLFVLIYFRIVLASFHEYTFINVLGPFSINALYSILMTALALLFINKEIFQYKRFLLIKIMIFLMLLSALINSNLSLAIPSIIKWLLLLELMVLFLTVFLNDGVKKVSYAIFIAFIFPVALQIFTLLAGVSKATENDGSVSYIGGFYHEAVFSVILFMGLVVGLVWLRQLKINFKIISLLFYLFFFYLLMMVNYRTTLISALPILMLLIYENYWKGQLSNKVIFIVFTSLLSIGLLFVNSDSTLERFKEIPEVYHRASELQVDPYYYTREERQLLSGRIYYWNSYLLRANSGTIVQRVIGRGMDSWKKYFKKYAHNTFISFYFELGLVGLLLLVLIFFQLFKLLLFMKANQSKLLLIGISMSFAILNLGTMPLWQIEGIFLFAFIFSCAYYFYIIGYKMD